MANTLHSALFPWQGMMSNTATLSWQNTAVARVLNYTCCGLSAWMYSESWTGRSHSASLPNWCGGQSRYCSEKFSCCPKSIYPIGCHRKRGVYKTVNGLNLKLLMSSVMTVFNQWRFWFYLTFHKLRKAILKSLTSPQYKFYGPSRKSWAGPTGGAPLCIFRRAHNQEVNLEARKLFLCVRMSSSLCFEWAAIFVSCICQYFHDALSLEPVILWIRSLAYQTCSRLSQVLRPQWTSWYPSAWSSPCLLSRPVLWSSSSRSESVKRNTCSSSVECSRCSTGLPTSSGTWWDAKQSHPHRITPSVSHRVYPCCWCVCLSAV